MVGETEASLAEYAALRAEILKRPEIRYQLLTFTLIATGAFVTIATEGIVAPILLLLQPIFATLIAAAWAHSDLRIEEIGQYIGKMEQTCLPGTGWQTHLPTVYSKAEGKARERVGKWYALGVFWVTQLLAIAMALSLQLDPPRFEPPRPRYTSPPVFWGLMAVDVVCVVVTWSIVRLRRAAFGQGGGLPSTGEAAAEKRRKLQEDGETA
jgi:hypothetical protein